jgi:hypothetical protein
MSPKHSYFELLCALAELGQLSASELNEFREHSQSCADCRQRFLELTRLNATMVVTTTLSRPLHRVPRGMSGRFIARAIREGVPINERTSIAEVSNLVLASATLLVLLVAGTIVGRSRITPSPAPASIALANTVEFKTATALPSPDDKQWPASSGTRSVEPRQRRIDSPLRHHDPSAQSREAQPKSFAQIKQTDAPDQAPQNTNLLLMELNFAPGSYLNRSSKSSRFKFSLPRDTSNREPNLLTACVCSPLAPLDSRTSFALASSAQFFQPNVDAYRTTVKPEFRPDPATLQLIENVRQ